MRKLPPEITSIGSVRKCQICKKLKPLKFYKSIDYDKTTNENLWGGDKSKIIYTIKPHMDLCNDCEADIHQSIIDEERERYAKDAKVLDELYSMLNKEQVEFIKYEIEESEGGVDFEIIKDKPNFDMEREKENIDEFNVWVDQSTGYSCDDYYGDIYVEIIPNQKYLKWGYSM